jgi:hypothetical protein
MPTSEPERVFRVPRWITVFSLGAAVALTIVSVHLYRSEGLSLGFALAVACAVLAGVGVADGLTTCVRLYSDSLVVTARFRRRTLPRADLESVTWEGGVGVSLRLKSGQWIKLPDVGNSQSVTNSIRAWLKRSQRHT